MLEQRKVSKSLTKENRITLEELNTLMPDESFVVFRLNQQLYALSVEYVMQIIPMVTIESLPQVDTAIEGLINVRGDSVVVVDLRRILNFPEAELGLHTPILLVRFEELMLGLIVDDVIDVMNLNEEDVVASDTILPEGLGEIAVLTGVIQKEVGAIFLININRLFNVRDKQAVKGAATVHHENGHSVVSEDPSQVDQENDPATVSIEPAQEVVEAVVENPVLETNGQVKEKPTQDKKQKAKKKKTRKKSTRAKKPSKSERENRK